MKNLSKGQLFLFALVLYLTGYPIGTYINLQLSGVVQVVALGLFVYWIIRLFRK